MSRATETVSLDMRRSAPLWVHLLGALLTLAGTAGVVEACEIGAAAHLAGPWLAIALLAVYLALAVAIRWAFRVNLPVGDDGVHSKRRGKSVFLPYAELDRVDRVDDGLLLQVRGEPAIVLRRWGRAEKHHVERVLARIAELRDASPKDAQVLLARGARSVAEWVADLTALATERGYRAVHLPPDRLWSVAEDPSVEPEERAAAALILRSSLDEQGKARLRVAAAACASPTTRQTLKVLADGEDEELMPSLEELARSSS